MFNLQPAVADFVILLLSATFLGMLAKKTEQPLMISYIITGFVLGPVFLNVLSESESIALFSELGLGFLLFLVGIEMNFDEVKNLIAPISRISILQLISQALLSASVAFFLGFEAAEILIITLATLYSSTAVVVKLLTDKNETSTIFGKIDIGVLIVQDIFVIMALAMLNAPSLTSFSSVMVKFAEVTFLVSIIGLISYASSKKFLPRVFKSAAEKGHIFFVHGIAWAFLFITVAQHFNISLEVGAFLAGLGLGQIPYNKELKERIRPLTDFFMVIFFASVGLSMTRNSLFFYWKEAVVSSFLFMFGGFIIMFYLIYRENFSLETIFKGSLNMTQISEFSLVLGAIAVSKGLVEQEILGYLSLTALITMSASAYLINYSDEIYHSVYSFLKIFESEENFDIDIGFFRDHALIVGYNRITERVLPVVKEYFEQIVVVDRNPMNVDILEESDVHFIFGDFKHGEIQKSSGLDRAKLVMSFSDEEMVNRNILEGCRDEAIVFQKASQREEEEELYDMGATYIIREDLLTAEKIEEYIRMYERNPEEFRKNIQTDKESLRWSGRDV